ncbi:hypothetical protein [Lutimaribacter pacificus]|nr:hypothetical protein [Lutimaribacter pacificus]
MTRRSSFVMGIHAPGPRLAWQAAVLVALAIALPCGAVIQLVWG